MSLKLILGGSGAGKSHKLYSRLIKASMEHPHENFILIVPEQYTMQTQKNIVELHPRHGVMNIDIVSFNRLAFRIFEECGRMGERILEDTGKRMVIRRVLAIKHKQLGVFSGSVRKSGFSGELKSMISELLQYNVTPQRLKDCISKLGTASVLGGKLKDLELIYEGFKEFIEGHYLTAEELLVRLCPLIAQSEIIRDSRIYLDNFTGFTPSQYMLMGELLTYSKGMEMTLTVDAKASPYEIKNNYELFYLTKETILHLERLCGEIHCDREADILVTGSGRFDGKADLAHLEKHIYRKFGAAYTGALEHIRLLFAADPGEETRFIARQIRRLVRDEGYRYRDLAVICGDVEGYGHMVDRAFASMEIPYFMDVKRNILENAFVETLRALLEMFAENFSYESVFRYLRSGFSGVRAEDADLLDNYVMAFGIRGAAAWESTWMLRHGKMDDARLLALNGLRTQVFEKVWPVYEVFKERSSTAAQCCQALRQWMDAMDMEGRLFEWAAMFEKKGQLSMAREYTQVYGVVTELLDKYENILGEEIVSIREYGEILDAGLSEQKMGLIPPGMDEVMVGDISRTRLDGVKVLFFMGINEGIVPAPVKDGGLMNDKEKEAMAALSVELSPTARQMGYLEQFYIYAALTKASDRVYLTYSQLSASGKALRPSNLIRRIQKLFPGLCAEACDAKTQWTQWLDNERDAFDHLIRGFAMMGQEPVTDEWRQLFSWFLKSETYKKRTRQLLDGAFSEYISRPLSRAAVRSIYGDTLENSVTTLENYAACAYAHFLQYGLGLEPRAENRIRTPDLGIIMHKALELFASALRARGLTWAAVPDDVCRKLSAQCAREAAQTFNNALLLNSSRAQYQVVRIMRYVMRTTWAIKHQLMKGDFEPEAFEIRFDSDALYGMMDVSLSENVLMKLTGTIDRIDLCEDEDNVYVKVVDYKSGQQKFDILAVYEGLSLQLVVYMNAAMALERKNHPGKNIIPAGILYYNIDDPMIERAMLPQNEEAREEIEDAILRKLKNGGLVNSHRDIIRRFDKEFSKDSSVIPVTFTAAGGLDKRSGAVTTKQFEALGRFVSEKVEAFGEEILDGNISVNPYLKGNRSACTYCAYRSVCGFDERILGFSYRALSDMRPDEAWEAICKEKEVSGDGNTLDG